MKKIALVALGALALTGCDFAGGDAGGVALPVANIQADGLDASRAAEADAPDLFVEIQNAAGQTIWRSATQENYTGSSISVSVPEAVQVVAATQGVMIAVWDYDTSLTDSDLMARSQPFTADQLSAQPELSLASPEGATFIVSSR